nr:hypothetical protein CFP56_10343 [Quercus suber]
MHRAVHPVVPCIFDHEEDGDLVGHGEDGWKWHGGLEAEVLGHGVEEPDLREFDGEMADEDELSAFPLFFGGGYFVLWRLSVFAAWMSYARWKRRRMAGMYTHVLDLVLVQRRDAIDDHPRQTAAEIDGLVHDEAHDSRGEDIVPQICVPRRPQPFEQVEVDIVLCDLAILVPEGVLGMGEHGIGDRARVGGGVIPDGIHTERVCHPR